MTTQNPKNSPLRDGGSASGAAQDQPARSVVQLPRFLVSEPVGAGTLVKRVTLSLGLRPCGGCEARATRLDSWLAFRPRR